MSGLPAQCTSHWQVEAQARPTNPSFTHPQLGHTIPALETGEVSSLGQLSYVSCCTVADFIFLHDNLFPLSHIDKNYAISIMLAQVYRRCF